MMLLSHSAQWGFNVPCKRQNVSVHHHCDEWMRINPLCSSFRGHMWAINASPTPSDLHALMNKKMSGSQKGMEHVIIWLHTHDTVFANESSSQLTTVVWCVCVCVLHWPGEPVRSPAEPRPPSAQVGPSQRWPWSSRRCGSWHAQTKRRWHTGYTHAGSVGNDHSVCNDDFNRRRRRRGWT